MKLKTLLGATFASVSRFGVFSSQLPVTSEAMSVGDAYIFAPDEDVRNNLAEGILENFDREGDPAGYDFISRLYLDYGLLRQEDAGLISEINSEFWGGNRSFEGVEFATNTEIIDIEGGEILDFRPLADLTNLKVLRLYVKTSIENLAVFENLTSLEDLVLSFRDRTELGRPLIDISALNDMPDLERIDINTEGSLQPIVLKAGYRKYELFDPIVLSQQFEDYTIQYSSRDGNFTNTDGLLKWNAIPFGTSELNLTWTVGNINDELVYEGEVTIPIIWK